MGLPGGISIEGGTSSDTPADEFIQGLLDNLTNELCQLAGREFAHLKAVSFKTQIVAGRNYFVKVDAGDEHLHVRIFEALPCNGGAVEIHGLQVAKSRHDPIEYF